MLIIQLFIKAKVFTKARSVEEEQLNLSSMRSSRKNKAIQSIKAQIQVLEKQVSQSRVAVENLGQCPVLEGKFKGMIQSLQDELQICITSINEQSSKNTLLKEIVKNQRENLLKYQKVDRKEEEAETLKKDKEIMSEQIEIDRILKKYNEEVAKINKLKQLANSRRSQRVVCSNLFKKLEKEIKFYEEIYKKEILNGESIKRKSQQMTSRDQKANYFNLLSQKSKNIQKIVNQNYQYTDEDSGSNTPSLMLYNNRQTITSQDITKSNHRFDSKFHSIRSSKERDRDPYRKISVKDEKLIYTKELLNRISQYSASVNKIKTLAQFEDSEQLKKHYGQVQSQNTALAIQIDIYDQNIAHYEKEIIQISKEERDKEWKESNQQGLESFNSAQLLGIQISSMKTLCYDEQIQKQSNHLQAIANLFQFQLQRNCQNIPTQESIRILDQKIQALCHLSFPSKSGQSREDNIFSQTIVFCLLQKMQKFATCQKIMDGKLLKDEYYKELGTRKQIRTRKQISK